MRISHNQILAIFNLLDQDESGELENDEIMEVLQDRQLMGQSRDTKAKKEFIGFMGRQGNSLRIWIGDLLGIKI